MRKLSRKRSDDKNYSLEEYLVIIGKNERV